MDPNQKPNIIVPASPPQSVPIAPQPEPAARVQQQVQGTPYKDFKSGPSWLIPTLVIFMTGFFVASGLWIFLPIIIPFVIWYIRAYKKQQSALAAFARQHGFAHQGMTSLSADSHRFLADLYSFYLGNLLGGQKALSRPLLSIRRS